MAQKNGHTPPAEKLEEFTFKDTGRTVQIRKVSTLLRAEARRQITQRLGFEEPQPPMVEVDYGEGKVKIPHPGHEVYQQLKREWDQKVTAETTKLLRRLAIMRGVVAEIDAEAVAQARADAQAEGIDLSAFDDHYVYVAFVCMGSEDDYVDLLKAVFERSLPQEAAVKAHINTFQADVPGEAAVQPEPGPASR
jgi:hypothetical protein